MQPTEFQIKDVTFYVDKFRPRQGFIILGDLQRELLPVVAGFFKDAPAADTSSSDSESPAGSAQDFDFDMFLAASAKIDSKMLNKWLGILITKDTVAYEKPGQRAQKITDQNFDDAFEDFTDIAQLLFEIIKLNFAGPLVQWLGHIGPGLNLKAGELLGSSEKN